MLEDRKEREREKERERDIKEVWTWGSAFIRVGGGVPRVSKFHSLFLFFFNKFIYFLFIFWLRFGLRCCTRVFSSCREQGLLFVEVHRLLIVVASLVAEHSL